MSRILKYSDGDEIIKRGTDDQRMFIIMSGKVEISMSDGLKKIILATLGKHDFFGEITLFNKSPRTADAIALGSVKLTYLDTIKELDDFLKLNPNFARKMAKTLAERIANTNNLLLKDLGHKAQSVSKFYW